MRIDPADLDTKGLYKLMISVIVPRPIAWVSTRAPDGTLNAAPFSYFQALSSQPPTVMISVGRRRDGRPKDTRANIEATGEFVVNVVSEASAERMVKTSIDFESDVSEFEQVGLEPVESERVAPPRIAECAVALECRKERTIEIGNSAVILGEVVLFHIRDDVATAEGTADPVRLAPLGRLGGMNYAPLRELVEITAKEGASTAWSELVDLWSELRDRTLAMTRALGPEHLARSLGGMTVGRALRHMGACTAYQVLAWKSREDDDEMREWDASWTAERIVAELEDDKRRFLAAVNARLPDEPYRFQLKRMIRHEAWHQGQIAAALREDFGESELWRL